MKPHITCQFRMGQPGMTWHCGRYTKNGASFCERHIDAAMNQIILTLGRDGWNATFAGPHAAKIVRLFGTDTIPMPFTVHANPEVVRRDTQDRNVDCQVVMTGRK